MVARQYNDAIIADIDKSLKELKMHLCAKFSCPTPDRVGEAEGQRNKHTDRDFMYFNRILC